jgi:hypothetical protein
MNAKQNQLRGRSFIVPDNSIMIDIETTGADCSNSMMVQIGACAFNDKFEITREYRASLTAAPNRVDNPDTIEWWRKTNWPLYQRIRSEERPYMEVLEEFRNWLIADGNRPILWAWPLSFDLMFLLQYGRHYYRPLLYPVHSSRFIDCRSWIVGARAGWLTVQEQEELFRQPHGIVGEDHDGLHDSRVQVWCLKRLVEEVCRIERETYRLFFQGNTDV